MLVAWLGALLGLGAAPDEPVLEGCMCSDVFGVREAIPLPANALHVVDFCGWDGPAIERFRASVDGRPVSIVIEPKYAYHSSFAFRLDPEPEEGQRVRVEMCRNETCTSPSDFRGREYVATARDDEPPKVDATPRIRRSDSDPTDLDHCNRFPKVFVHADGIDLGAEPVTYMDVRMSGPGKLRGEVWRLHDERDGFERNDDLPVEIDAYEGRWCADVTLLDAAGNERSIGRDCERFSCSCRASPRGPGAALLLLVGLVALGWRRRPR